MALFDWRVTPEYINEHWTEEMLLLLFNCRAKRVKPVTNETPRPVDTRLSSDAFLHKWSGVFNLQKVN